MIFGMMIFIILLVASLAPDISCEEVTLEYQGKITDEGVSAKVVDIQKYVDGTYGQTIRQIKSVAVVSALCSLKNHTLG